MIFDNTSDDILLSVHPDCHFSVLTVKSALRCLKILHEHEHDYCLLVLNCT